MQLSKAPQRAHGVLHTRPIRARGPHLEAVNDPHLKGSCPLCHGAGGNCPECSGWEGGEDEEEEAVPAIATTAWPMPTGKPLPWDAR